MAPDILAEMPIGAGILAGKPMNVGIAAGIPENIAGRLAVDQEAAFAVGQNAPAGHSWDMASSRSPIVRFNGVIARPGSGNVFAVDAPVGSTAGGGFAVKLHGRSV